MDQNSSSGDIKEVVFNRLKEMDRLDLWPTIRVELLSLINQGYADEYLAVARSGKKADNIVNSWVAYILGICDEEPTGEMKMMGTPALPDIDSDFDKEKRESVIDTVRLWFGEDNVASIGTYGVYRVKSATQAVMKYFGENPDYATRLSKSIPYDPDEDKKTPEERMSFAIEGSELFSRYISSHPEHKQLIGMILGAYSSLGKHPGGTVLSPQPIQTIVPMARSNKGEVTALAMKDVEKLGLVKFDFLGVANITIMQRCLDYIREIHGVDIDLVQDVPLDNPLCIEQFDAGNTDTIFQFEKGLRFVMQELDVTGFDDVVTTVAICRPESSQLLRAQAAATPLAIHSPSECPGSPT